MARKSVSHPIVNGLWQSARSGRYTGSKLCPACKRRMIEVPVAVTGEIAEYVDVCTGCHFIWFDTQEFEGLPKVPPTISDAQPLPKEAQEALAVLRLDRVSKEQEYKSLSDSSPDHWLEVIPAIFGIPIEYNYTPLKHNPIVTWLLAAVIVVVSIIAFTDLESVVGRWGLIPAELDRYFGLTFITSFFLHAGFFHLLVNLYFLIVFGDNTEDVLGKFRYVLLIVLASLAGDVAHILSSPGDMTPVIGASGGISGILAYYCLRFPGARVGILWWFRWFRVPVGMMFAFWVLSQIFEALRQATGLSHVAAFAHLAGACVGAIFWAMDQEPISKTTKDDTGTP